MANNSEPWFYDCNPGSIQEGSAYQWIERFYCFDWEVFCAEDHAFLRQVYEYLPGWIGFGSDDCSECAYWFGTDEAEEPYLCAGQETPSLQVNGILLPEQWEAWDAKFRAAVTDLPKRTLT